MAIEIAKNLYRLPTLGPFINSYAFRCPQSGAGAVRAGVRTGHGDDIGWWIEREIGDPENTGFPDILFLKVPDSKVVKNRLHLDLLPDDQEMEVARLEKLGAKRIDIGQNSDPDTTWVVMTDPEGNEFCILRALIR